MTDNDNQLIERVGPAPSRVTSAISHIVTDLGKNGIFLALIAVIALFAILTNGILLRPQNISNLIVQNGYILVLAVGMVMVIVQALAQGRTKVLMRNTAVVAINLAHVNDVGVEHARETGQSCRSVDRPLPYAVPVLVAMAILLAFA